MVALQKDMRIRRMMVQDSHIAQGLKKLFRFFCPGKEGFHGNIVASHSCTTYQCGTLIVFYIKVVPELIRSLPSRPRRVSTPLAFATAE